MVDKAVLTKQLKRYTVLLSLICFIIYLLAFFGAWYWAEYDDVWMGVYPWEYTLFWFGHDFVYITLMFNYFGLIFSFWAIIANSAVFWLSICLENKWIYRVVYLTTAVCDVFTLIAGIGALGSFTQPAKDQWPTGHYSWGFVFQILAVIFVFVHLILLVWAIIVAKVQDPPVYQNPSPPFIQGAGQNQSLPPAQPYTEFAKVEETGPPVVATLV
mmetsp:Transcript_20388/g.32881  ORF Transcript_20388/g.32881 Transcript_20388/m.32881 type:complete len:214 (+) Transcript_20388:32-673(+)